MAEDDRDDVFPPIAEMTALQRLDYRDRDYLHVKDFEEEQGYHIESQKRCFRYLWPYQESEDEPAKLGITLVADSVQVLGIVKAGRVIVGGGEASPEDELRGVSLRLDLLEILQQAADASARLKPLLMRQKFGAQIAVSATHSLALTADGHLYSWARGEDPKRIDAHSDVVAISCAEGETDYPGAPSYGCLALKVDGTVQSWKAADRAWVPVLDAENVIAVSAGGYFSLALTKAGEVLAWGGNSRFQLGAGHHNKGNPAFGVSHVVTRPPGEKASGEPIELGAPLSGVSAIAAGFTHSLALRGGEVWGWGHNVSSVLGGRQGLVVTPSERRLGARDRPDVCNYAARIPGIARVKAVDCGRLFSLALDADGRVWVWGDNTYYIFPGGDSITETPQRIDNPELQDVQAIAAGAEHCLALTPGGGVKAWGGNVSNQLGREVGPGHGPPGLVAGLPADIVAIAAGGSRSLALDSAGTVWEWGDGVAEPRRVAVPEPIKLATRESPLAAGPLD